jgi:hypothetical protein
MTFQLVCLGWIFFRSDSVATALTLIGRLFSGWNLPTQLVNPLVLVCIAIGLGTQYLPHQPAIWLRARLARLEPVPLGLVAAVVLFMIASLGPRGVAPFIYFQF